MFRIVCRRGLRLFVFKGLWLLLLLAFSDRVVVFKGVVVAAVVGLF